MAWSIETKTCTLIWTSAILYAIYCFAIETKDVLTHVKPNGVWNFLERARDPADSTWETFLSLCKKIYMWLIFQVILTKLLIYFKLEKAAIYCRILISSIFIAKELGRVPFILIFLYRLVFSLADLTKCSTKTLWIFNVCSILFINTYEYNYLSLLNLSWDQRLFNVMTSGWINLKCVSYYIDCLKRKNKKYNEDNELLYFLDYCLYLPTFVFGPVILYEDFKTCYHRDPFQNEIKKIRTLFFDTGRCLFWMVFVEFWLHFIYDGAISYFPQRVTALGSWSFYGFGYCMAQHFHITYVVMYGLSTSIAKYEGMNVPTLPKCIGRIHLYSDMWKYFDAGLYKFIVRYIYIPAMKNRTLENKLFSSLLCFIFIYIWHGLSLFIFIWSMLNFIGVTIESLSAYLFEKYIKDMYLVSSLGENWIRRLACLLGAPLFCMSLISNFYFFAEKDVGDLSMMRVLNGSLLSNTTLFVVFYCGCQASTELKEIDKTKNNNKSD